MIGTAFGSINTDMYRITVSLVFLLPFSFGKTRRQVTLLSKSLPSKNVRLGLFETAGLTITIFFLLITFLQGLASTPILDDPVAVWLVIGKRIYLSGRFPLYYGNAPDISWASNWPPNASFIAAGTFFLLNKVEAFDYGLIPWFYGTAGLLTAYVLVRELNGTRRAAIFAVLVVLFTTIYPMEMMGWGYVDTMVTFYVTAFLAFTFMRSGWVDQNGLFAALSFALAILSKYNALLVLLPSFFLLIFFKPSLFKRNKTSSWGRWTPLFLAAIAALGASWYIRNWVLVGDPLYPYLYNLFTDRGVDRSVISLVPIYHEPLSMIWSDPTFTGLTSQGNLWPLLALGGAGTLSLLVATGAGSKRTFRALSIWTLVSLFSLLGFIAWRGGFERYLVMLVPAISVCAGFLVDRRFLGRKHSGHITRLGRIVHRAAVPSLFLALILVSPSTAYFLEPPRRPPEDIMNWLRQVNELPAGTIATNDLRLFYFDHPIVELYNMQSLFSATTNYWVWRTLKSSNVTYVYFNVRFDQPVFRDHTLLLQTLQDPTYSTLLFTNDQRYPSYGEAIYLVK